MPWADRLAMVKAAASAYDNVTVVPSGSYMISAATFPSYFLKDDETVTHTHALLDAALFARIAAALHITKRYVGEEPFSAATRAYNAALMETLPPAGVDLCVMPRAEQDGRAISASTVRQLIHDGRMEDVRPLVPQTTWDYLTENGQHIVERIQKSADVVHH